MFQRLCLIWISIEQKFNNKKNLEKNQKKKIDAKKRQGFFYIDLNTPVFFCCSLWFQRFEQHSLATTMETGGGAPPEGGVPSGVDVLRTFAKCAGRKSVSTWLISRVLPLIATMYGVCPPTNTNIAVPTVSIEAAGSGAVLVPALPLHEGTTCAQVKEEIAKKLNENAHYSYALMLGHGGREIKDEEIISTGTDTLVLVRRDPFCMQFNFSDYDDKVEQYSFDFVIDGETIRVEATGEQIEDAYWNSDYMLGLNWDIKYEGDKKIFVAMKSNFDSITFQLQLVMYKFDCNENIEQKFICETTVDNYDFGHFSTNGTINGVPVVLSIPMKKEYCCTDDGSAWENWYLNDITIKTSDGEDHPFNDLFTTKSFDNNYFAKTNFAIVPYL